MFTRRIARFISLPVMAAMLLSGVLLSGCSDDEGYKGPPIQPKLSFTRYQPIFLNVANIEFVDEYRSPEQPPFVEHLLPISPAEAMKIWVRDRIRPVGLDNTLQIIIRDARVVGIEVAAQQEDMVSKYFTGPPNKRYDARLEVEMRIYNSGAISDASITVVATQSSTIPKDASLNERKMAFMNILYMLMESTNAELEKQIFHYFPRYIIYAQTP